MHTLMLGDYDCKLLAWCQKLVVLMASSAVLLKQDRCCKLPFTIMMMAYVCGCDNHVSSGLSLILLESCKY